jgi:hypothetical protein
VLEIAEPGAAPFFLHGDAVQAEPAQLRPEVAWEGVGPVDVLGARLDLGGGEAAHGVAQHLGILSEREVQSGNDIRDHAVVLARSRPSLGHDPEKWIPVFGKDHASARS